MSLFAFATVVPSRLALALSTALVSPCAFAQAIRKLNKRVSSTALSTLLTFATNAGQPLPARRGAELLKAVPDFPAIGGAGAVGDPMRCEVFA